MASPVKARLNKTEFDRTMKTYRQYSKRDPETICNTKGYFICRRATVETQKATKTKILEDLSQMGRLPAPMAALIVQSKRGKEGQPGLYGRAMKNAVDALIKARRVATLAAGWIPAIKRFQALAESRGAPRQAAMPGNNAEAKGYGRPAKEGWKAKAEFANMNSAVWDTQEAAVAVAMPGLERAFAAEEQSMKAYIERKFKEAAQRAGVKTG